ncbi:MAG: nucleoside phosphorylase [Deltaproteobacteria bacterium]|nr:nucleoside phosphorylase [Deltaproteobacteria bacterium]
MKTLDGIRQKQIDIKYDAVINPPDGIELVKPGRSAALVSSREDLQGLCHHMQIEKNGFSSLFMSRVYVYKGPKGDCSLTGPVIGAPYAVMVLEKLIALGVTEVLYFGWCGSISHHVRIGDIIVPTQAIIDEGTSRHYEICSDNIPVSVPSSQMASTITRLLKNQDLHFHEGVIWTTDAVYRETPEKVLFFQNRDVLGVEMETSALFTVGHFRQVEVSAVLVVSDELSTMIWRPGFQEARFKNTRRKIYRLIESFFN